ncbi:MAG: hypothetical protein ACLPSF_06200 [Methylocella sp.]
MMVPERSDQVSETIRITDVSGDMAKIGVADLLNLAELLSVSVGL